MLEFVPEPGRKGQHQYNRNKLKRVGVFGKKPEPNEKSGQRPMPGEPGAFFQRNPECDHCRQPEKNRQRINRHHKRADVENGRNT